MPATKRYPQPEPDAPASLTTQEHRLAMFLELGFDEKDSECLSRTHRADGFLLYWGDVKKFLDAGASREQIVDWFTYPEDGGCAVSGSGSTNGI